MIGNCQEAQTPEPSACDIEISDGTFVVDAAVLGALLDLPAARLPILMRERAITSLCERGVGDHEGKTRLTFFYRNRRARLSMDSTGRIFSRSVIDFGDRPIPDALHRSAD